jgi:hypothetical protein
LEWVSDVDPGGPIDRASNRVRAAIERGAEGLPGHDGSLFRGLVVGDDRDQPPEMIRRFRASGLSHLTAVSGQNVSFVLAAAGPLLRVLRPWGRWAVTLGLIAWFVSLTRFEPSIARVGTMVTIPLDQVSTTSAIGGYCRGYGCHSQAWTFPAVPYALSFASGYEETGQISRIEIHDGGFSDYGFIYEEDDDIVFYDGSNDLWEARSDSYDTWGHAGPIPVDLAVATEGIDIAEAFYLTLFSGSFTTYNYDYTRPQGSTIVTRTLTP